MQQGGGSPYGAPPPPEQSPSPFPGGARVVIPGPDQLRPAEPASPISSRPPPLSTAPASASASASASAMANFDDPAPSAAHGNFPADDFGERVAATGSRWPRQETLALLKIRSDMDAAFRDATLKAPLWEEISRKLAELGYRRNAKKCKEKFENVHKYYKRTKEGRAGRQDGKSYRFFDQLEALHGATATSSASTAPITASSASAPAPILAVTAPATATATPNPLPGLMDPSVVAAAGTSAPAQPATVTFLPIMPPAGISFSSNTSSSSASESEDTEGGGEGEGRKGKRGGARGASRKMLAFFEGLMRQVIERQEAMQQRLMEAIEKREQDRMVREEAWRRQEMARLAREHELLAQERAAAASRDAAVMAFLQTLTGQSIQLPPPLSTAVRAPPSPPPPPPTLPQQLQTQQPQPQQHPSQPPQPPQQQTSSSTEIVRHYQPPPSTELVPVPETQETARGLSLEPASSRWPKVEVHALISLRSSLDARYQEAGPKGPLWEEISSEMRRLGYNRSAKRCKEKWENINKYFKKVKESNKRRPEDAKTCPYFHQLDALYRQKHLANTRPQEINPSPQETTAALAILAPPPQVRHPETENKNGNGGNAFEEGTSSTDATMKPEDFVKELMKSSQQKEVMDDYDKLEELESEDDDVDDDEDEGGKMQQYRVQFQRPNQSGGAAPTTGSFLAMV